MAVGSRLFGWHAGGGKRAGGDPNVLKTRRESFGGSTPSRPTTHVPLAVAGLHLADLDRRLGAGSLRDNLRSRTGLGIGADAALPESETARHVGSAGAGLLIGWRRLGSA